MKFSIRLLIICFFFSLSFENILAEEPISYINLSNSNTSLELNNSSDFEYLIKRRGRRRGSRRRGGSSPFGRGRKFGRHFLSGGVGSGLEYGPIAGLQGSYDFNISPRFSTGLQGNVFIREKQPGGVNTDKVYALAIRTSFHFFDLTDRKSPPVDLYVGIASGGYFGKDTDEMFSGFEYTPMPYAGIRYALYKRIASYAEVGWPSSSIGFIIMF